MSFPTIDQFNFNQKRALIRVDFNVPLNAEFQVTDDTRLRATLPTIQFLLSAGASVILMSHLGRPKDGPTEKYSLKHLVTPLSLVFGVKVKFATDLECERHLINEFLLKSHSQEQQRT